MNPIPKTGVINPKAEYIITVSWPDNNPDDIDTYVQNPTGGLVWFRGKERGCGKNGKKQPANVDGPASGFAGALKNADFKTAIGETTLGCVPKKPAGRLFEGNPSV